MWKNEDGTTLETDENVAYGVVPTYDGATPIKTATAQYTYTFEQWDNAVSAVTGDIVYTAKYTSAINNYTVLWKNEDGTTLETDENVAYGTTPQFNGVLPIKAETAEFTYTFGWNSEITVVVGDKTYVGSFTAIKKQYTYTFYDDDGVTSLKTEKVDYGTDIIAPTAPLKQSTEQFSYAFDGWYTAVSGGAKAEEFGKIDERGAAYYAKYNSEIRNYSVVIKQDNYEQDITYDCVPYGSKIEQPSDPKKNNYLFEGWYSGNLRWDFEKDVVTKDVEIRAEYLKGAYNLYYSNNGDECSIYSCVKNIKEVVIPEIFGGRTVTSIESLSFKNYTDLVSITLPESIKSIGDNAFEGCVNLERINFPRSLTSIGKSVFLNCKSLKTIYYNSVSLGNLTADSNVFENAGCEEGIELYIGEKVKSIPSYLLFTAASVISPRLSALYFAKDNNIEQFGEYSLCGFRNITELYVNDCVTKIGTGAFNGWSRLSSVSLPFIGENADGSGNSLFTSIFGVTDYNTDKDFVPEFLQTIEIRGDGGATAEYAFANCENVRTIKFSEGMTSFGKKTFLGCKNLINITLPQSLIDIEAFTFKNCIALEKIEVPEQVQKVGEGAFNGCSRLTVVDLPDSVKTIEKEAFTLCPNLSRITIGTGIEYVGEGIRSGNTKIKLRYNRSKSVEKYGFYVTELVIPENIKSIEKYEFGEITGLRNAIFPMLQTIEFEEGIISIGDHAFAKCKGLQSVTFPDSLEEIGNYAFQSCEYMQKATIGAGLKNISSYVFDNCPRLKTLSFTTRALINWCGANKTSDTGIWKNIENFILDGQPVKDFVIPYDVQYISMYSFKYCQVLTSVAIGVTEYVDLGGMTIGLPSETINVGYSAFAHCNNLKTVTIGESVTSLDTSCFAECENLNTVNIAENVNVIGTYAFYNDNNISKVNITNIDNWCKIKFGNKDANPAYRIGSLYLNDKLVETVSVPVEAEQIDYLFSGWKTLKSVKIVAEVVSEGTELVVSVPSQIATIKANTFEGCTALQRVELDNSTNLIENAAFKNCSALEEVVLGKYLTSIGDNAFEGCAKLRTVYFIGTMEEWAAVAKGSDYMLGTTGVSIICSDGTVQL